LKKGLIFNIFQKFQKDVNSYPMLYQNAKFGDPGVKMWILGSKNDF